jgi:thiol-disulfide isomerase/thioredoxin
MQHSLRSATLGALALVVATSRLAAQDSGIAVGSKAPSATVETLDGTTAELSSVIGKGPVVIEFWATWCPNCKELEPTMAAAMKKYAGKVTFIGVAVSANQTPRAVQAYADKHLAQMRHFYDRHGKAVDAYEVPATSFVVIVNKAGQVVYTGLGGHQALDAALAKVL